MKVVQDLLTGIKSDIKESSEKNIVINFTDKVSEIHLNSDSYVDKTSYQNKLKEKFTVLAKNNANEVFADKHKINIDSVEIKVSTQQQSRFFDKITI